MLITEAIKNNQKVGIALSKKFNKDIKVFKSFDNELSDAEIRHLYTKLLRLEKSYKPFNREFDNSPTKDTIEYLANGGLAMLSYCRLKLKSSVQDADASNTNSEQQLPSLEIKVHKSSDEALKQVTYVAMQEGTDAHGDYTSNEEIRKAKESFNRALVAKQKLANLFHLFETSTFDIIESYLLPCDAVLNDNFVQKGSWLVTLQINDDALWEAVLKGDFVGVSIGALAQVENLEESDESEESDK